MKSLKDIITEGVAVSSDFKLVNSVNAQGKPITRKVRAHRKTISPEKMTSEEKPDVLASIQKFVGRQYDEEVEQVDEVDSKTLASFLKKNPGYKVDSRSTKERIAASKEKSANQMKRGEPTKMAPASKADVDKQIAKSYSQHKSGQYVGDSIELDGEPIVEAKKSAAVRWQEALQKAKKQREEEDTRKKENEKRALTSKPTNEAKEEDDEEDYSKNHKLDPDSGVEADQHIHVQLKKAIDSTMKPYEVTFKNGKKHSVSSPVAKTIVSAIEKLKPEHRKAVHDELHKSYDSLMGVHKMITGK